MTDLKWTLKAIGYSGGYVKTEKETYHITSADSEICFSDDGLPEKIEVLSERGKFADSEDSFLYLFCEIDPCRHNIALSARFEVPEQETVPDYQTGYGILAADTAFSGNKGKGGELCRHRNHILSGRFRTYDGRNHGYGMRVVAGYTSPEADEYKPVRKLDPSRTWDVGEKEDSILPGDDCTFRLIKTSDGFLADMQKEGHAFEKIFFPGCSFLMKQDKGSISVGFAVAGKIRIRLSDIHADLSAGSCSDTPEDEIRCIIPDYPFRRTRFDDSGSISHKDSHVKKSVLFVSPDGSSSNDGTQTGPLDLNTALSEAGEGTDIVLLDGQYVLKEPLYLPSGSGGNCSEKARMRAQHPGNAILDGSELKEKVPLVILRGRYWILEGLVFQNAPASGLFVCGSGNLIRSCEARHNGDTGILLCAYPGEGRENWPSYNTIEDCDSYDNCDPVFCNADGFGAKLSVGKGNLFFRCISHHNIDDGFDLYSKSIYGPIGPVTLEKCIAYENGATLGNTHRRKGNSGGIGFKLGGEHQPAAHELWDCMAFMNVQKGFSSNTNPAVRLYYCTSYLNGRRNQQDDYHFYCRGGISPSWIFEGTKPRITDRGKEKRERLPFRFRKSVLLDGERPKRREDGSICLPWTGRRIIREHRGALLEPEQRSILFLITTVRGGGAERVTTVLASELSKKYPTYLLTMYSDPRSYWISSDVRRIDGSWSKGTPLEKIFGNRIRWPFKAFTILRAKQKYHIDTTISMLHKPNLYNGMIRWMDRRILSERNDPSQKPVKEFEDAKRSFERGEHVVFQSEFVQKLFSEKIRAKSSIIRNPISVTAYADPAPGDRIVTVGRYIEQKNHVLLIRAFDLFRRTHPSYTLHLYGDGELRGSLQELIEELHLENTVFLEGFRNDIHPCIKDARMFVLSSDFEGMSNALMEAMMMGLPCISTECTGSTELIENGKTGLLVPLGDEAALSGAMTKLADDDVLWEKIRDQAQLSSIEFEKGRVIRAWERIIVR